MNYDFKAIEKKWQHYWAKNKTFAAKEDTSLPKYYGLSMFPYPSGAGLHVGHPLGYIASCIYARYKRLQGMNVLHPMGYDSFGLPAEQYAIQTGQHPAVTTEKNSQRYRQQLDKLGLSLDWSREVRTADPAYYKWTQWIFKQLYTSWYNCAADKAESIDTLVAAFESEGNAAVRAATSQEEVFSAAAWHAFSERQQQQVLMRYRLAFLADAQVNWCPALGTVLAHDEVKDGLSERGGHPVEQKLMKQWNMRITAYAERLLDGLATVEWSDAIKEQQRHWIGKSTGSSVRFQLMGQSAAIEVFTTRPDTLFGVSFLVLAPEHALVSTITTAECAAAVQSYQQQTRLKTERERQAQATASTGQFTGAYAVHPLTGEQLAVWIADYVLVNYGTGAVMAVPAGDRRDWHFAQHFDLPVKPIFEGVSEADGAYTGADRPLVNAGVLNGLFGEEAIEKAVQLIEEQNLGKRQTQYRIRDAVFSRQRFWGEPFPIYYREETPYVLEDDALPVTLPHIDHYLPTADGDPPLARAAKTDWNIFRGDRMEYTTMPGWAGSSWYFLRYMDPHNETAFVSREKAAYWQQVDLYIGGAEHAVGHLLYARFWTQFLCDRGYINFREPFKKLVNQGMILGRSNFVYRDKASGKWVSYDKRKDYQTTRINVDISCVENDRLNVEAFRKWLPEYAHAEFILSDDGTYHCGSDVEKMSKSKFNVQTPDALVERYGADTLRCYAMFLGPLEQTKPWNTKGINGVHHFLKKLWRLFYDADGQWIVSEAQPDQKALRTLHKTIKKIKEDLDRLSFNTVVSHLMIAVNELTEQQCSSQPVLRDLLLLVSPYAPHIAEELWSRLGEGESIAHASFPSFNPDYLVAAAHTYPISFNGKMRFKQAFPTHLSEEAIRREILQLPLTQKWLDGKTPEKIIVIPEKIVNLVVK